MPQKFIYLLALCPALLFARKGTLDEVALPGNEPEPWFTGPLLAPSGHVIPLSHQNIEPYVFWNRDIGHYNRSWHSEKVPKFTNVLTQISIQCGVLPGVEFDLNPTFSYNNTQGEHQWVVNDTPMTIGIQLFNDGPGTWNPAVKLRLAFNLPIGRYERLNPFKFGTDIGGLGAWLPTLGVVLSRTFNIYDHHFLAWRLGCSYTLGTTVDIVDFNIYGGAPGTDGTVHLGNTFVAVQGLEYSLTQNWVLALDILYRHTNRRKFSGFTPPGTTLKHPSLEEISLAPAIEYNFSANVGIIVGPWFSIAGRNSAHYHNWVFAINIYH